MNLKTNLLMPILENSDKPNKYSKAYTNLVNVLELEDIEEFQFDNKILDKFKQITDKYNSFICDIPLRIIERYYIEHISELSNYIFIEYDNKELKDVKVIDLFNELELFYDDMFNLACLVASHYNLEIKLNEGSSKQENNFL